MSHNPKNTNEEEALENALAPIVDRLIDKNFENSQEKMASNMAPLIGGAIREQIKSQKDDIVDALYPVMGNMISKFVTKSFEELLHKINAQIQSGLSFATIQRKIKAKIKGVSETELLLEENYEADIKAALLIHKESGMLLAKVEDGDIALSDTDMLASMMTAIRSFVNEWVANNSDNTELGEIEYGGNKIIIESGGSVYLAVIVEGAVDTKSYEKIRSVLSEIITEHATSIKNFQGDYEALQQDAIEKKLAKLLTTQKRSKEENSSEKMHPLLLLLPLLLLAFIGYKIYQNYIDEHIKSAIVKELKSEPLLRPYAIDVDVEKQEATLSGLLPFNYYKELAAKKSAQVSDLKALHNEIAVKKAELDPLATSAHIAYLLKGFNLAHKTNIDYTFDYDTQTLHLKGQLASKQLKKELLSSIEKIEGISKITEDIALIPPEINAHLYFKKRSSKLTPLAQKELIDIIEKFKPLPSDEYTLVLESFSDMLGSKEKNRQLAQKRLNEIKNFLQLQGALTNKIETSIHDEPPEGVDATKNPSLARRIEIKLKQGE